MKILIASANPKKLRELREQLAVLAPGLEGPDGAPVEFIGPGGVGGLPEVIEDGHSFRENAAKKARSAARATGLWSLGDDSGLEVDSLDGAPGIYSARFSGPGATDERNNALLLERLAGVPEERRGARFVCALALARPDQDLALEVEGTCRGRILEAARGTRDFGYDPLFLFTEAGTEATGYTFAELESAVKALVSHRGRAIRRLLSALPQILAGSPAG